MTPFRSQLAEGSHDAAHAMTACYSCQTAHGSLNYLNIILYYYFPARHRATDKKRYRFLACNIAVIPWFWLVCRKIELHFCAIRVMTEKLPQF